MTKRKQKKTNVYPTEVNISKMQSLQKIAASSNSNSIGTHGVSMSSNENRKFDFSYMNPHFHVYLHTCNAWKYLTHLVGTSHISAELGITTSQN
jgi:hypothetical protein